MRLPERPPAAPPEAARPREGAAGFEVNLIPDETELALLAPVESDRPRPLWHRVTPRPGALVSLWSRDDRLRAVRLTVTGRGAAGWDPRWVRWSYAVRRTPKDLGGDALAAQDALSDDDRTLTLLLLPGEQRSATLEFVALLDGETRPGLYPFDVVVTDVEDGTVVEAAGQLRLSHPESRLLTSLPSLYEEAMREERERTDDPDQPPFFERYLRGFDDQTDPMLDRLGRLDQYLDPDDAPADFLPWLAQWVALLLDGHWPQLKRRRLIKEIVELYRWRGTRYGLARYLELYTGTLPEIHDQPFAGMRLGPDARLGANTVLGDVPPHTFVITLAVPDRRAVDEKIIRAIIEMEKPAHAAYLLQFSERTEE